VTARGGMRRRRAHRPPGKGLSPAAAAASSPCCLLLLPSRSRLQDPGSARDAISKRPFLILLKREPATSAPFRGRPPPPERPQQLLREKQVLLELVRE